MISGRRNDDGGTFFLKTLLFLHFVFETLRYWLRPQIEIVCVVGNRMPLCKAFICSKSIYPFLFCEDLFCFWVLPHTCQYDYTESFLRTQVNLVLSMHVPKMNEYIRRFIWTSSWLILFQPSDSLFRCQQTRNSIVTNSMYNPPSSSYHWFKSTYQLAYTAAYTICIQASVSH